jgi:fumarate hydratase subunit beta
MATYKLKTPISEEEVRKLKVNDVLYITGSVVTARDQAHKRALEYAEEGKALPVNLHGLALFHCGPVVRKQGEQWVVVAAGPTTSTRMDIFEAELVEKFKVRVVIGKGGMGEKTVAAMAKYGAVYCAFTGGAAVLAAKTIKRVRSVEWLDLGAPEAMWVFEVSEFGPLLVAVDSHNNNLFKAVADKVAANTQLVYRRLGL